ncbi:hypothetical protein KIW84_052900 [Lathyrus oleraceus]|uniref:EDR1/CTR1/ARMC3-like peptidase-like domain-containing protein n=1 Tax=Pisum sativum TaxID=3888 RepID=A0A9D4WPW7_PEA|nr:hypothetical protein KIW84_052900 [Pisum sativum]
MGGEGFKADVIVVDAKKDRRLSMLKQLIVTLVKGLSTNPAAIIKKIARLVSDFYKRANVESPAKAALEKFSHMFESRDIVGLESRLMMGFPNDGASDCVDSYKHMSMIVVLNSVELLVDLMRFPGQLLPRSINSILMTHISAAGESDSAENESAEKDDNLQFHRRFETSLNVSGPTLRSMMLPSNSNLEGKLSLSHSEPNIATSFGRRSRRKVIAEQMTTSSSPEHPLFQARGQYKLGRDKSAFRDFADDQATSRSNYKSNDASSSEARRIRRRSISITPEVGDDIASTVYNITRHEQGSKSYHLLPWEFWTSLRSNVMTTPILQHFVSEGTATLSANSAPTLPGANKGTQDIEASQIQVNANQIRTEWATLQ